MHTPSLLTLFFFFLLFNTSQAQLVVNEIYADVAPGTAGDANRDGSRGASEDEFIELFYLGEQSLDVSGYQLAVNNEVKHTFSDSTILANGNFVVVFGGGTPAGNFGGSHVITASEGTLSLTNNGGLVTLLDTVGNVINQFGYEGANIDASWVRTPDGSGDFVPHTAVDAAFGAAYSPGTRSNSFPFYADDSTRIHFVEANGTVIEGSQHLVLKLNLINSKTTEVHADIELVGGNGNSADLGGFIKETVIFPVNTASQRILEILVTDDELKEGTEEFIFKITSIRSDSGVARGFNQQFQLLVEDNDFDVGLRLTEVLADPPTGEVGDANGDGSRSASEDEFIELQNRTDSVLNVSGLKVFDSESLRHRIADSTFLQPEQLLVIFGGGSPNLPGTDAIVQTATSQTLSLSNNGDQIIIRDTSGNIVLFYQYDQAGNNNQSIVFCQNTTDTISEILHLEIDSTRYFSPGLEVSCNSQMTTSTANFSQFPDIAIFPNPARNVIQIVLPTDFDWQKGVLMNQQGKVCQEFPAPLLQLSSNPAAGLYFLQIHTRQGIFTKKIIIK